MAQKPIGFYGKFTPTGVDDSSARRMQALAGLAGQVGGMAEAFGIRQTEKKRIAAEQAAPEQAAIAVEEALAVDPVTGEKTFGAIEKRTGFGASIFNQKFEAGYVAGMQNEITDIVSQTATNFPADTVGYTAVINKAMKGLTSNMPVSLRQNAESYFHQINRRAVSTIATAENKINTDIALGEINTAISNADANITSLAFEGKTEELKEALISRDAYANEHLGTILDPSTYAGNKVKLKNEIVNQLALGEFDRALRDDSKAPSIKIQEAEASLKALKAETRIAIADPVDPEKTITLTPDQKNTLVTDIGNNIESFKDAEIKAAQELREVDEFTQIANYDLAMITVQDEAISPEQKMVSINKAEATGQVRKEDAVLLRRYVNSVKALSAVTNSQVMGDILVRVNDLNANLNYTAESKDYLSGINNIRAEIMTMRATGQLSQEDENKLNKQMTTLTSAKIAGATVDIANGFSRADKQIQTQLNSDLWGTARRALFDQVELEVEELNLDTEREKTVARKELYNRNVTTIIQNIQSSKRLQAIELVNTLTAPKVAATITSQAEYDALPSGAEFVENGITYRKP